MNLLLDSSESQEQQNQNNQLPYKLVAPSSAQLPKQTLSIIESASSINQKMIDQLYNLPPEKKIHKQVCAKVLKQGDALVECYDCRLDRTCVICLDCFKNGNHEGHKYVLRDAVGGCCDCGDKQAWKQNGFCKNHSGKFKDFNIDQNVLKLAKQKLHQLFYLYFYLNITQSSYVHNFNKILFTYLNTLNKNKMYYNKLTALCLCCPLIYKLNPDLDNCTVLQNILKVSISGQLIKTWFDLFMGMFGYYPFKIQLTKCYIQKFGDIVEGQKGFSCGGNLSCQLITSYQLIQRYCENNNIGIGQGSKRPNIIQNGNFGNYRRYYLRMFYDLTYINKLTGKSSLIYWRMHINSKQGISNLFNFCDQIYQYQKKLRLSMTASKVLIYLVDLSSLEQQIITVFTGLVSHIKYQKQLMYKVINFLWIKCKNNTQSKFSISLYRTYERCLGIILFAYFGQSLNNIKQSKIKLAKQILNISVQQLQKLSLDIFISLLRSYLIYPKAVSQPGFGQSIQLYMYYYKIKFHLLSTVDIVSLKIFILLNEHKIFLNLDKIIQISDMNDPLQKTVIRQKKLFLNSIIRFLKYLYTFTISQIYLSSELSPNPNQCLFLSQINDFLLRFFIQHNNVVSIQKMNLLMTSLFSQNFKYIKQWLNNNCIINKQKKQFILNKQHTQKYNQKGINLHLNINDIWQNKLAQNFIFSNPFKSKQVIESCGYNNQIFQFIWSKFDILNQLILKLYEVQNQGIQLLLSQILPIYLMKRDQIQTKQIRQNVLLRFKQKIPLQIRNQFKQLNSKQSQNNIQKLEQQNQIKRRRSKAEQIKLKKLQKMKQKQQKFIMKVQYQQQQQPILPKLKLLTTNSQKLLEQQYKQQYIENCCICKNDNKQDLVYLVNIEIKNITELYKIREAINCISFNSCFHTFDYKCLKQQNGLDFDKYICPLCKTASHYVIPINLQNLTKQQANQYYQRILLSILLNFQPEKSQINPFQHFQTSFYHFVLISYLDVKNFNNKNTQIYQAMFKFWLMSLSIQQIKNIQQNIIKSFIKPKISHELIEQPKKQQKTHKSKHIRKTRVIAKNNSNQTKQSEQLSHIHISQKYKIKSPLYEITYRVLFKLIYAKLNKQKLDYNTITQILNSYSESRDKQFVNFVYICLKLLMKQPLQQIQINFIENFPRIPNLKVLKQLPKKYSQIGSKKFCSSCKQISNKLIMCLLCQWIGCQNCINGQIQNHKKQHKGVIIYMVIQTSIIIYKSQVGEVVLGKLYENIWGQNLLKNQKWEDFQLNLAKVKEIQNNLILDRPINSLYPHMK